MAKLSLVIHPLFFLYGLYFALTGKVFSFICTLLTALLHEIGHYYVSNRLGYKISKIVLMPYGAVLDSGGKVFSYPDEIKIAFAGPITNLILVIFFVALWWIFPDSYPYTELVVTINLVVAAVNLLPCYPLDGGRILSATLSLYLKRKTAIIISKIIGLLVAVLLLVLFVISCFNTINISLLFFALFVLFGFKTSQDNRYIRAYSSFNPRAIKRGAEIKRFAVSKSTKIKELFCFVTANGVCELVILDDNGKIVRTLSFEKVNKLLTESNIYLSIDDIINKI